MTHGCLHDVEVSFPHMCDVFPMAKRLFQQTTFEYLIQFYCSVLGAGVRDFLTSSLVSCHDTWGELFFTLFENMANNMETVPTAFADENIEASNNTKAKKTATKTIWTDDMVETLIEAYQEHECLWNMSAAEYKDNQKRSLAYEAVDLNLDIYEVKRSEYCTKWTNLRTQFLREHNNYKKTCKSGAGTSDVHQPTWKWYTSMKFLITGEITLCDNNETGQESSSEGEAPFKKPAAKLKADLTKKRMQLLDKSIAFLTGGDEKNNDKENTATNPANPATTTSEEESYGRFITNTLNRFDPYQRMFAKKRIGDVLFEIEYASYQSSNSAHHTSYPSSIRQSTPLPSPNIQQQIPQPSPQRHQPSFTMSSPVMRGQLFQHMQQQKQQHYYEQQQQPSPSQQQQLQVQVGNGFDDSSLNGSSSLSPHSDSPSYETFK